MGRLPFAQAPLHSLPCGAVERGDLLIPRMKIIAYNPHCLAPFFEPRSIGQPRLLGRKEPTPFGESRRTGVLRSTAGRGTTVVATCAPLQQDLTQWFRWLCCRSR